MQSQDQVVPVAILAVLWLSVDAANHKLLSGIKVRTWVSTLLSRSIILGSTADGVAMHE